MSRLYNNVLSGQTEENKKPRKKLYRGPDDTKKATKKAEGAKTRKYKKGDMDKKSINTKAYYRTDM